MIAFGFHLLLTYYLQVFDNLFADFEFGYGSAMVPVKSVKEYNRQLDVAVLFSDCLARAIRLDYITREQIDDCDPNVIIGLPRLAIVWGLLFYPEGALNIDLPKEDISEMFRHSHKLLILVRNLLLTLNPEELGRLEQKLVSGSEEYQPTSVRALEQQIESIPEVAATVCSDNIPEQQRQQQKINQRHEYDPRDDFPEPGLAYVLRNPRSSQFITIFNSSEKKSFHIDRSLYGSSDNLIHRLFVCVAGVADQLQTNYSSDIRKVLKMVIQPVEAVPVYEVNGKTAPVPENEEETGVEVRETLPLPTFVGVRWVPDSDCDHCTACSSPFSLVRRRHHCRNCGRIFCGQCSAYQISISELGYDRKVRVCDLCFEYRYNQQEAEELRGQLTEVDGEQLQQQQVDRSGETQSPEQQQLNSNSGNRRNSADRPVAVNLSACSSSSLPSASSSTTAALPLTTTTTTTQDQQSMLSVHKLLSLTAILLLSHRSPLFASTLIFALVDMANATDPLPEVNQTFVATPLGTLLEKLDNKIDTGLANLNNKIDTGLANLDNKIDQMGNKIDAGLAATLSAISLAVTIIGVILGVISLTATFALFMGICPCYKPRRDVAAAPAKGPESSSRLIIVTSGGHCSIGNGGVKRMRYGYGRLQRLQPAAGNVVNRQPRVFRIRT